MAAPMKSLGGVLLHTFGVNKMRVVFILPEEADPEAVNIFLDEACAFIKRNNPDFEEDNIGRAHKIDEKFIDESAEGFPEFRTIGTKGLCEKYIDSYKICIYGYVEPWVQDMIKNVTGSQRIVIKDKKLNEWGD